MIVVISGPGGVGKGTVVDRLLERDPSLWLSRSWTTRARRPGESEDAYRFVGRDEFMHNVEAGGFIEWVEFLDYLQGSPVPSAPDGQDTVFEIDVHGARQILEQYPDALSVFIDAPSRDAQRRRLIGRGDRPEHVERRLAKADEELAVAKDLGSIVVINDDVEECVAEVRTLIEEARARTA